jgi:hypothetical protein
MACRSSQSTSPSQSRSTSTETAGASLDGASVARSYCRSQGPRPRKLPQQQRRAAFRQASCTEHPHSASTSSDGQLLAATRPRNVAQQQRRASCTEHPIRHPPVLTASSWLSTASSWLSTASSWLSAAGLLRGTCCLSPATRTPSRTTPPARERAPPSDWDCVEPPAPDDGPDDDVGVMGERRVRADRRRATKVLGVWLGRRKTGALRVRDAPARGAHSDALPTAYALAQHRDRPG